MAKHGVYFGIPDFCNDLYRKIPPMPAHFYEQEIKAALKNKRILSGFLDNLARTHKPGLKKVSLNYIFCTDEYLLQFNQQYLNHDTLTDIITFDLSDNDKNLTGEIYVSIERVKENATKFGVPYQDELHRVVFHGALHLCGFKDKSKTEQEEMRKQENQCLEQYKQTLLPKTLQ
jgi:rRNA maturation RNase YbeY